MKDSIYAKLFKSCPKSRKSETWINSKIITLGLAFCLSGCMGVYEGGFECPPGEGVGCKSISEVNEMVNQGLGSKVSEPREQESRSKLYDESKGQVCGKNDSCPLNHDSPDIWYAPRVLINEPLLEA